MLREQFVPGARAALGPGERGDPELQPQAQLLQGAGAEPRGRKGRRGRAVPPGSRGQDPRNTRRQPRHREPHRRRLAQQKSQNHFARRVPFAGAALQPGSARAGPGGAGVARKGRLRQKHGVLLRPPGARRGQRGRGRAGPRRGAEAEQGGAQSRGRGGVAAAGAGRNRDGGRAEELRAGRPGQEGAAARNPEPRVPGAGLGGQPVAAGLSGAREAVD